MTNVRRRQLLAVLLLVGSVATLVWAMAQSNRAVGIQGPGALVVTPGAEVWVGVDDRLLRLGPDGSLLHDEPLAAVGLPAAPSNLLRHPQGFIVATVRDDPTLYLLDAARARVVRQLRPQWPADLERHGGRAINLGIHPDGRIAIATGGGHAVALFQPDGRFVARTAPELYRFTNGLWWLGDALWTTDTNRTQLKRLDGQTLALQQTVQLRTDEAARFLGPARPHPQATDRVALIRFHNGMTVGRLAVLGGDPPAEVALAAPHRFEPIDVDWLADTVVSSDGSSHQLLRLDPATGTLAVIGDGRVRQRLDQGLRERERGLLHWKLGLAAAAGLMAVALLLAWRAQTLQRQADEQRAPLDLAYLGTPQLGALQLSRLQLRLLAPWLLFTLPVFGLQLFNVRGWLGLTQPQWRWVLAVLVGVVLLVLLVLQRRQSRLALDPAFEPVLNRLALDKLRKPGRWRQALRPDETVLETCICMAPTLHWLVLTDLRLLCFVATLRDEQLAWAHARHELTRVRYLPRAPRAWQRWVGAAAGGPGWLQLKLPKGATGQGRLEGRVTAPSVARRLVAELQDTRVRALSSRVPAAASQAAVQQAQVGPAAPRAALLSLLVPGWGQWLQQRSAMALLLFGPWALALAWVLLPALWTAWAPRAEVNTRDLLLMLVAAAVYAALAAWDAWRLAPRR